MAFYSSGVEYGLHSLLCMVDSKGDDREMNVREMAELQGVPFDYLAKIFTRLSRAGLVVSTEGKGGGFRLARAPELITMLDVAQAIDGSKTVFECKEIRQRLAVFEETPPAWACDGPCSIRAVMDSAQQRMEEELARHTILDLARRTFRKAPDTFAIEIQDWISERRSSR
ncbi:RrF2 family transcriptional regulator [Obesumbacterium proteus]|uniref:RrF2 family transcriptional regulator n=1 Tax=Obesumbacterium proteus TaxID=82983 RepID=UPI001F2BB539|nr:Rrf2 family transcriptional regulator [Obesumbacterium proteus]MCE9883477.1 Rrf2 family transcriptional regulator [Obesumbacterium proteus]MCE9916063.1 Rrf2 family transcriptional regulator [Obesumbacterium proteus]MCE9928615.1 Rrf2 family transcriptional regulator [Obesumbacterium proteus]MCG2877529.1 Rrf2 family transcriptional regulator [Obesumbacterium proteus]